MLDTLRRRDFGLLWLAGLISMIGDWVLIAVLPYHLYAVTGSALAAGGLLIAYTLPGLLLGSIAGVFVDRWDRRRTMVAVNLLRAPLMLVMLAGGTAETVWLVYLVAAVESALGQLFGPAENALLPSLVSEDRLVTANSLNVMNNNLARLAGPSLGAAMYSSFGLPGVIYMDGASYLLSALFIALIGYRAVHGPAGAAVEGGTLRARLLGVWREWLAGLRLVRREQVILGLFIVLGVATLADGFNSPLLAPFVKDILRGGAREFAWLLTAQALSGLAAGILMGHMGHRIRPERLIILSTGCVTSMFAVAYNVPILPLVLGIATLLGFPATGFFVSAHTLIQSNVVDEYRGRVFGALGTTNALLSLCALGISGAMSDHFGVRPMLNVVVGLWLLTTIVAWRALRPGRKHSVAAAPHPAADAT